MMKQFQVLERSLILHRHYLLEASAGTGKTFSIQNIVVRLLIEPKGEQEPLLLQKILVVTFTRAATRDLKIRIRANIDLALQYLQKWMINDPLFEKAPDYLKAIMEQGKEAVEYARKRLQHALFTFDQAQIFTIHSFCARMLRQFAMESDMGLHAFAGDEPLPKSEVMGLIRDFFRTEIRPENYSPAQLEILLRGDPEQRKLLKLIQNGYEFPHLPAFNEVFRQFHEKMSFLKDFFTLSSEKMMGDFRSQSAAYRNHKGAVSKAKTLAAAERFAQLFDQKEWTEQDFDGLIEDGLIWTQALDPLLIKGTPPRGENLHYPFLTQSLKENLSPLIHTAGDFVLLLSRMGGDCQELLKRYQREEEKLAPDDVLRKMQGALQRPPFLAKVQAGYQAAIIDEFQDTDPLQWQIFKCLFIPQKQTWEGFLYLVGDPKQSIYSFRQADIYTYLAAAQILGEAHCFSLNVNYRSQPRLVEALNTLFSSDHLPLFIPLPKTALHLSYQPVEPASSLPTESFEQSADPSSNKLKGAIHFFIADSTDKTKLMTLETDVFFPFISGEILRQKKEKGLMFHDFAILVRDRHQGQRLAEHFDRLSIPYLNQRGTSLAEAPAHLSLIHLLQALLHPQDRGMIRAAMCTPLMGWTPEEVKLDSSMEFIFILIHQLRFALFNQRFAAFFQTMLHSVCKPNGSLIGEQILRMERGLEFYRDLQQIADLIADHEGIDWSRPEGIISFLDHFQIWEQNEDARVKRFQDPTIEGVKILSLHFSKGLEFEIVFALGLVNRIGVNQELIPVEKEGRLLLTPLTENSEEYIRFCEECDAEKMRQLYVALTRAKTQLFIPALLHFPSEKLKTGEASPMDLYLARLAQAAPATYQELYERIRCFTGKNLIDFLEETGKNHFISYSIHQEIADHFAIENEKPPSLSIYSPSIVSVPGKPLWITSFSSLSRYLDHGSEGHSPHFISTPRDYESPSKSIHTLPANHETGLLLHHILEKLSFQDLKSLNDPIEVTALVRPFVLNTPFREWEQVIAELVFNALKTPLSSNLGGFCLADLREGSLYREMPFVFPHQKGNGIEEINFQEGLIKGVIDCLITSNGFYYLLDWKTNWLGPGYEAYTPSSLHIAMKENDYFLQASLYTEAIKRYLALVEKRPFEECFGGTFYLFLRGMQPDQKNGIYHFGKVQASLDKFSLIPP